MTDRPILFSAPMVRALRDGRKTQTRRALGSLDVFRRDDGSEAPVSCLQIQGEALPRVTIGNVVTLKRLKAAVGDRLWVRETFQEFLASEFPPGRAFGPRGEFGIPAESAKGNVSYVAYRADGDFPPHADEGKAVWRSSIHMARKFSRLTLTVTDVRVQRLREISKEDAIAEGLIKLPATGRWVIQRGDQYLGAASFDPRSTYAQLWDEINGPGSWDANPWVAAYTFAVERRNIDEARP